MAQLGRILGCYQLLNELGRGGMGAVYKANDYSRDRIVAMKILPSELAYTRTFMQRFEREIETLQRLRHPNIVQMYDVGEVDELRFYCMEYVDGGSVERRLEVEGRFPLADAVDIAYQVTEALEYAHAQGVVHRDIKPANILLIREGTAKLTDFGVAKVVEATQVTVTSGIVGTIEYLAPEQATGGAITPATDIYSLGATLYEMVTGRSPFQADTPTQILHKQLHSLPEQPKYLRPEMPDRLNDAILKMLEKQPERRISSAQALKRELERIKVQLALHGRPLSAEVLRRQRSWQDWIPLGMGLGLLLLVGLFLYHSLRPRTAEELFADAQRAFATQEYDVTLARVEELQTRFPQSPLLGELDTLQEQAHERLAVVEGVRDLRRDVTRRELSARGELRRARSNFGDGDLDLALGRCGLILQYYGEFPEYVDGARKLMQEIEREKQGPAPARETPAVSSQASPASSQTPNVSPQTPGASPPGTTAEGATHDP
jgi:serine/threonine protein kinase